MGVFIVEHETLADRFWQPDATLSQSVDVGWEVTEHEIEEGADITDHVRKRLETTTMRLVITDTPLSNSTVTDETGRERANEVLEALRDLAGIELDIFTEDERPPLRQFLLTGMPYQLPLDNAIIIQASFKEARFVSPAWTDTTVRRSGSRTGGQPGGANRAPFAGEEDDGQGGTEELSSTLYDAAGSVGSVLGFGGP